MKTISNGKNNIISNNLLPNMSETIMSWFQSITFTLITRTVVDYDVVETKSLIKTQGVVQPYKPEPLEIQTAGTRSWSWQQIHCLPDVILNNGDYIIYKDVRYKVLYKKDYSEYGYVEYMLCEGFEDE